VKQKNNTKENKMTNWAKTTVFKGDGGQEIVEFEQISTGEPKIYRGGVTLLVRDPSGQVPPQHIPFSFMFPDGTELAGAMDSFDSVANKAIDDYKKEQAAAVLRESKKIVPASSAPMMFSASGRPMGR
jgi:hypothetical protein